MDGTRTRDANIPDDSDMRTRGGHLTRSRLALGMSLVLIACAVALVALVVFGGLPPRRLVRSLIGLMPSLGFFVWLFVMLAVLVASMLRIFAGPDHGKRTKAWYQTRNLLAVGVGAMLLPVLLFVFQPTPFIGVHVEPPLVGTDPFLVGGSLGMLIGLAWMIRIFRDARDEPPPWRYRDR